MPKIDLLSLGIGNGSSYVLKGIHSTAFAILIDDEPLFLIDAGAGIGLSCKTHLGVIPSSIYITHNHMDHAGDLPVILSYLKKNNKKGKVFGHRDIIEILRTHRMHDTGININEIACWIEPNNDGIIDIGWDLDILPIKTQHSYTCYGFILRYKRKTILGYTGDTPFDKKLFNFVTDAPIAIINARDESTLDHPSIKDVNDFAKTVSNCSIWISHYEITSFSNLEDNVHLVKEGQRINIWTSS